MKEIVKNSPEYIKYINDHILPTCNEREIIDYKIGELLGFDDLYIGEHMEDNGCKLIIPEE